jgi:hypothetical protein
VTGIPYRGDEEWPAVPAVRIQIGGALGLRTVTTWGKIDTGASRTIVPSGILEEVGAFRRPRQVVACRGYDGTTRLLPLYEVDLSVDDPRWPEDVESQFSSCLVVAVTTDVDSEHSACEVLLGRDILAAWHLHLDGRNSRYTVS